MPGRKPLAGPDRTPGPAVSAGEERLRLCFAYGSNLEEALMRRRCPGAVAVSTYTLKGYRLCFRGYADVEPSGDSETPGVLYRITPQGERLLDFCEGVAENGRGLYRKETFAATDATTGQPVPVLFYQMNDDRLFPPDVPYYRLIHRAYRRWGFPLPPLEDALRRALGTSV